MRGGMRVHRGRGARAGARRVYRRRRRPPSPARRAPRRGRQLQIVVVVVVVGRRRRRRPHAAAGPRPRRTAPSTRRWHRRRRRRADDHGGFRIERRLLLAPHGAAARSGAPGCENNPSRSDVRLERGEPRGPDVVEPSRRTPRRRRFTYVRRFTSRDGQRPARRGDVGPDRRARRRRRGPRHLPGGPRPGFAVRVGG